MKDPRRLRRALSVVGATLIAMGLRPAVAAKSAEVMKTTMSAQSMQVEPNMETAKLWWDELPNKWTAVGWKDHILKFSILHNGTVMNTFAWLGSIRPALADPQAQFSFTPAPTPADVTAPPAGTNPYYDDNSVVQSWAGSDAPVLQSDWAWQGYVLREEVFAHIPGGQEVKTGNEPLFAWVRLSVHDACDGIPLPSACGFGMKVNYPGTNLSMKKSLTLSYQPELTKYPRALTAQGETYDRASGFRIMEPDGRVRVAVAPNQDCTLTFKSGFPAENDTLLHMALPAKVGAHVDLLIPMLPAERSVFDKELALGYDNALREANRFWAKKPATAARFEVPEDSINQAIRRNIQFSEIMAEKSPETGQYYMMTGAMGYGVGTWSTCVTITMAELLDTMGYYPVVEKYLQAYKKEQGTAMPPGECFQKHDGYLGTPKGYAVVNWLPDHGALLWLISQHMLLSGDEKFAKEWTPVVVKACDWIKYARRIQDHDGVKGIMPPAGASDDESRIQNCWTDGWMYKGISAAVEALKMVGHPRAAEFEAEAKDYKATFLKAFRAKMETMPEWSDSAGKKHHLAPLAMAKEQDWQYRHLVYLDTGPMYLVFSGLFDADDEAMRSSVAFFREGPVKKMFRVDQDYNQVPCLHHEVSSWEICYSWNIFHSWQLGDRAKFIEGLYSLFAGGYSQQTYTVCEERGGMSAATHWMPSVYLARLAVIDDRIRPNELHLLRLIPLAWLSTTKPARFERIPTEFGPVTLKTKLTKGGSNLDVTFSGASRKTPAKTVLHIPPVSGLKSVTLNGKDLRWNGKSKTLTIPAAR